MPATRLALACAACGLYVAATARADSQAPSFSSASAVNTATGQSTFAPYSICTIYGTNLYLNGSASATATNAVPNSLAGVSVVIAQIPAGIFYVSANQINLLIPNSLTPGTYPMLVMRNGITSDAIPIVLQEVAPGIFYSTPGIAVALHSDGTPITGQSPATPGEIAIFFATGLGRAIPDPPDRSIPQAAASIIHAGDFQFLLDGVPMDPVRVLYVGVAPFSAGLYQINVRLPDDLWPNNPEVQVSVAGVVSPRGPRLITAPDPAVQQ
jgi:uncharacterized protein (TIGR03437 family)